MTTSLNCRTVLELDGRNLSFETFRDECLIPNRPAIIRHANEGKGKDGQLFFDLKKLQSFFLPAQLMKTFGKDLEVPVTTGQLKKCSFLQSRQTDPNGLLVLKVCDLASLNNEKKTLHSYFSGNVALDATSEEKDSGEENRYTYLKDWHYLQQLLSTQPPETPLYTVPNYLGPDWLQEYWAATHLDPSQPQFGAGEDYRFTYIGEVGSATQFHHDVCGTYSWSFNVYGVKRWCFPLQSDFISLINRFPPGRERPTSILEVVEYDPHFKRKVGNGETEERFHHVDFPCEIIDQLEGDLVFVPALYYHECYNVSGPLLPVCVDEGLTDGHKKEKAFVMSINHNWCNEFNVMAMSDLFQKEVQALEYFMDPMALKDMKKGKEWEGQCDRMLRCSSAWDRPAMDSLLRFAMKNYDGTTLALIQQSLALVNSVYEE